MANQAEGARYAPSARLSMRMGNVPIAVQLVHRSSHAS